MKDLGNNLSEMRLNNSPTSVINLVERFIAETQIADELFGEDFDSDLGGRFYLVESEDDLSEICLASYDETMLKYHTLADHAGAFDMCEYTECGEFVQVLLCTNNAGGNVYLIPKTIAEQSANVLKSIELTNASN